MEMYFFEIKYAKESPFSDFCAVGGQGVEFFDTLGGDLSPATVHADLSGDSFVCQLPLTMHRFGQNTPKWGKGATGGGGGLEVVKLVLLLSPASTWCPILRGGWQPRCLLLAGS